MVWATVALEDAPEERVLAALHDGLKSEISFELRLYKRQEGFLAWLGDRPVVSRRISRVGSYDLFTSRYVIEGEGGQTDAFGDAREFLRRYLVVDDYPLSEIEAGEEQDYYVLARARLSPVRILGPLNIVTLFSSEGQTTTDWVERALGGP